MTVAQNVARPARADSIFFPAMAWAMAAVAFTGFAPSFYLRFYFHSPAYLSPLLVIHGMAFTAWPVLMIVQTSLVAANRRDIHRKLGVWGGVLAAAIVVLGLMAARDSLQRHFSPLAQIAPASFFIVPLGAMAAFVPLVTLGIVNRKRLDDHKRYMLMSVVALLSAALARVPHLGAPPVFFAVSDIFIVAMVAYDFATRGKVHRATLVAAVILIASQVGRLVIGPTAWWQDFANLFA